MQHLPNERLEKIEEGIEVLQDEVRHLDEALETNADEILRLDRDNAQTKLRFSMMSVQWDLRQDCLSGSPTAEAVRKVNDHAKNLTYRYAERIKTAEQPQYLVEEWCKTLKEYAQARGILLEI